MSDINIYEVGPRDGLQNSDFTLSTKEKISMIEQLYNANLKNIEVASFVHPKLVPNMADAEDVFKKTKHLDNFGVLVPNQKGFDRAKNIGVKKFNLFLSPSDEFNIRNLGKKLDDIYPEVKDMTQDVNRDDIKAYISCAFGCPFTRKPSEYKLRDIFKKVHNITDNIVLCDTIGATHPTLTLSLHLHERKGKKRDMFDNVKAAIDWGVTDFDASIAGLGGCPFIPDSGNNLSTNELIEWSIKNNYETGIELTDLSELTDWLTYKKSPIKSNNKLSFHIETLSNLSSI